jgi:hypothetical protein
MVLFGSLEARVRGLMLRPWVVGALLALMAALGIYLFIFVAGHSLLPDFAVYLRAAEALREGRNIYARPYEVEYAPGEFFGLRYLYPPFLAHVLSKGLALSEPAFRFVWSVASFGALALSVVQVSKLLEDSWWREVPARVRMLIISFFFLCFEPLASGGGHGQVTAIVLCLLSTFMLESVRRNERTAGLALALAIHIKMTPVLLLLAPVVFRRWRTVGWCFIGTALLALPTIVDIGSLDIFFQFLGSLSATSNNPVLRGAAANFAVDKILHIPFGAVGQKLGRQVVMVCMLIAMVACARSLPKRTERDFLVLTAFLVVCMIMVSPIVWFHHFAWLLLPIAISTMRPTETPELRMKQLTISVGILFSISKTLLLTTYVNRYAPALTSFALIVPTALLLCLCLVLCSPSRSRESDAVRALSRDPESRERIPIVSL